MWRCRGREPDRLVLCCIGSTSLLLYVVYRLWRPHVGLSPTLWARGRHSRVVGPSQNPRGKECGTQCGHSRTMAGPPRPSWGTIVVRPSAGWPGAGGSNAHVSGRSRPEPQQATPPATQSRVTSRWRSSLPRCSLRPFPLANAPLLSTTAAPATDTRATAGLPPQRLPSPAALAALSKLGTARLPPAAAAWIAPLSSALPVAAGAAAAAAFATAHTVAAAATVGAPAAGIRAAGDRRPPTLLGGTSSVRFLVSMDGTCTGRPVATDVAGGGASSPFRAHRV